MAAPNQFRHNPVTMRTQKVGVEVYATAYEGGWNGTDDTVCLQAAIDSGADRVIVTPQAGPWVVSTTEAGLSAVVLASNQRIIFRPGTEVVAKAGSFLATAASMFRATNKVNIDIVAYGATFTMLKADYVGGGAYAAGDARHGVVIEGCTNVGIYGATIVDTGGDGVYFGPGTAGNNNCIASSVTCTNCYRNGISVIDADGLWLTNITATKTAGTATMLPGAAIDFEPIGATGRLKNITVNNLNSSGNCYDVGAGTGGILINPINLDASSDAVSMVFNDCESEYDYRSLSVFMPTGETPALIDGSITFNDCTFTGGVAADGEANASGITIRKSNENFPITFNDCTVDSLVLETATESPVLMSAPGSTTGTTAGGLTFNNLTVVDSVTRSPFRHAYTGDKIITDIDGNITLNGTAYELTTANLQAWMPQYDPGGGARFFTRATPNYFALGAKLNPGTDNFWVSFWCKQELRVSGEYYTIINTGATTALRTGFWINIDNSGYLHAYFNAVGIGATRDQAFADISPGVVWTHCLVSFDRAGLITAYKNGTISTNTKDISADAAGACAPYADVTSCIGAYYQASAAHAQNGAVACLAFGHGTLPTEAERAELFAAGASAKYAALSAGLKAKIESMWNLDETSGNALDATATANHGTDTGTVTYVAGPAAYVVAPIPTP